MERVFPQLGGQHSDLHRFLPAFAALDQGDALDCREGSYIGESIIAEFEQVFDGRDANVAKGGHQVNQLEVT